MALEWIAERAPRWDEDKVRIVGEAPTGIFDARYRQLEAGSPVPGQWWHVEEDGRTVGYGWLEVVWGDAEILLAVDPGERGKGIGAFIVKNLAREAHQSGLNYIYNVVRPTHPDGEHITQWLVGQGFTAKEDARLVRRSAQE